MSDLLFLDDFRANDRPQARRVTFSRQELRQLLSVYSRRVESREWKDYSINHDTRMAIFSIFRKTSEPPLYTVAKLTTGGGRKGGYLLFSGRRILRRGNTIAEVLALFEKKLRLISTRI